MTKLQNIKARNRTRYKNTKNLPYSWIGRIYVIKMSTLLKAMYRSNAIPIKIPTTLSDLGKKMMLKFILKCKRP